MGEIKVTALHQDHEYLAAQFCSYNGIEAVARYGGGLELEDIRRASLLLCDVSCLPFISITGQGAKKFTQALLRERKPADNADDVGRLYPAYILNEHEEVVDLVLAASLSEHEQLFISSPQNFEEVFGGLKLQLSGLDLQLGNETALMNCLAVLAPQTELSWLEEEYRCPVQLSSYHVAPSSFDTLAVIVYKVALSQDYALYLIQIPQHYSPRLWRSFLSFEKFVPCGISELMIRIEDFFPPIRYLSDARYYPRSCFE